MHLHSVFTLACLTTCLGTAFAAENGDHICLLQDMETKKFIVDIQRPEAKRFVGGTRSGYGSHDDEPNLLTQYRTARKQVEDDALLFATLNTEKEFLNDSNDKLSRENEELQKANQAMSEQVEDASKDIEEAKGLKAEIDDHSKKLKELESNLIDGDVSANISAGLIGMPELSRNADQMQSDLATLKKDLAELTTKNKRWHTLLDQEKLKVEKVTSEFVAENQALRKNITEFSEKNRVTAQNNDIVRTAFENGAQERERAKQTLKSLANKVRNLEASKANIELTNRGLEEEIKMMKDRVHEVMDILAPVQ